MSGPKYARSTATARAAVQQARAALLLLNEYDIGSASAAHAGLVRAAAPVPARALVLACQLLADRVDASMTAWAGLVGAHMAVSPQPCHRGCCLLCHATRP